jgi:sRNA-binding carbon storage regulator CsrA
MPKKQRRLFWNLRVSEKVAIGDNIITIVSNPRGHVRVLVETSEPEVKIIKASNNANSINT